MKQNIKKRHAIDDKNILKGLDVDTERFGRQVRFLIEIDKLKKVLRQTYLTDTSRLENTAEHSWHIALAAMVFGEYANNQEVDISRVVQMLLVHDLIEIDAGDTYCYDENANHSKKQRELQAAERIFKILPEDQAKGFRELWDEFEASATPEALFASALDRYQPFLHNYHTEGKSWKEHSVHREQVIERMHPVQQGSEALWEHVARLLEQAVKDRLLDR